MLMPNTPASGALTMAEHLRDMIQRCGFNYNGVEIDLTLSCGISEFYGEDRHEDVFERADQALYQAKQSGRNRCLIFDTAASFNHG